MRLPAEFLALEKVAVESSPPDKFAMVQVKALDDLVLAGTSAFTEVIHHGTAISPYWHFPEGELVLAGQSVCSLKGSIRDMAMRKKNAFYLLERLSGIATFARCFAKEVEAKELQIVESAEASPFLAELESEALQIGLGKVQAPHTVAVFDRLQQILMGGMAEAFHRLRQNNPAVLTGIECVDLDGVREAVALEPSAIVLHDHEESEFLRTALSLIPRSIAVQINTSSNLPAIQRIRELGAKRIGIDSIIQDAPRARFAFVWEAQAK